MTALRIPNNGRVVVGDGRKALLLRNEGDALYPNLVVSETLQAPENLATAAQGADAPGRAFSSADGRRSAVEQTDWHRLAESAFARKVALAIDQLCQGADVHWLALVAPPHILSEWRDHLGDQTRKLVKAELPKELTKHPIYKIERMLTQARARQDR